MSWQKNKILIISLDGATFDVIRPLVKDGYLPNLGRLMMSGSHSDLESSMTYITPAAWTSFMTGKHPDKHGVFDFLQFNPHTYETRLENSQSIKGKTIWKILSEKGKKVAVIHLPMTYPPYEINGCMVSGFDTPSVKTEFTYPRSLKKDILNIIPDYNFHLATIKHHFLKKDFETFINQLRRSLKQRHSIAKYLLEKETWDVFMINFQDLDCLQHNFWQYIDYRRPDNSGTERKKVIYELFRYTDALIGDLLFKTEDKFSHIIVLSDHGAGPAYMTVHPNSLLKEWGFLSIYEQQGLGNKRNIYLKIKKIIKTIRGDSDSNTAKNWLNFSRDTTNWANTKAYVPIADIVAFCYINRAGREGQGIITDIEYDGLCNEIKNKFLNTIEPLSGRKVFKYVFLGQQYFKNTEDSDLPDLILIPNDGFTVNKAFTTNGFYSTPLLSGTHKMNGILIIKGEKIKQGFTGFKANIIDMAPTILYILDLPIPCDMDGQPLLDIIAHNEQKAKWEDIDKTHPKETESQLDYKEEEKEQIEKRLKSLGYL